jgi:hypothetical protein
LNIRFFRQSCPAETLTLTAHNLGFDLSFSPTAARDKQKTLSTNVRFAQV